MPPVQTPRDSQSLVVDNYDVVVILTCVLSLLLVILMVFLPRRSITHRRGIYGIVFHRTTTPDLPSPRARNVRKETLSPTVSALVLQSILIASHHLRLGIVPNNPWPSSAARCPRVMPAHGLKPEPPSRRRANIRQLGVAPSPPSGDGSCITQTIWFHPTFCGLRMWLFFGLFPGLRQQSSSIIVRKSEESQRHTPDVVVGEPTEVIGDSGVDVLELDSAGVPETFLPTEVETGTLQIPLIILSLPSSEHIIENPSPPVSLDEGFLCPDGTFRSSGRLAQAANPMYDISDATRLALASRLRHRQKRAIPLPSPDIPSVRWL